MASRLLAHPHLCREPSLFVQLPGGKSSPGAVQLVWIPAPLEKYCLGKTHKQCASVGQEAVQLGNKWSELRVLAG